MQVNNNNFKQTENVQTNHDSVNHFLSIPDEILLKIFSFLDENSLVQQSLVCKRWYCVSCDQFLWKRKLDSAFPSNSYELSEKEQNSRNLLMKMRTRLNHFFIEERCKPERVKQKGRVRDFLIRNGKLQILTAFNLCIKDLIGKKSQLIKFSEVECGDYVFSNDLHGLSIYKEWIVMSDFDYKRDSCLLTFLNPITRKIDYQIDLTTTLPDKNLAYVNGIISNGDDIYLTATDARVGPFEYGCDYSLIRLERDPRSKNKNLSFNPHILHTEINVKLMEPTFYCDSLYFSYIKGNEFQIFKFDEEFREVSEITNDEKYKIPFKTSKFIDGKSYFSELGEKFKIREFSTGKEIDKKYKFYRDDVFLCNIKTCRIEFFNGEIFLYSLNKLPCVIKLNKRSE